MTKNLNLPPQPPQKSELFYKSIKPKDSNLLVDFFPLLEIKKKDLAVAALAIAGLVYIVWTNLLLTCTFGLLAISFIGLYNTAKVIPLINKLIGTKITLWHVSVLIVTGTLLLSQLEPAHAIFLDNLETALNTVITDAGIAIPANAVSATFGFIRVVFLLAVGAGGVYAYVQAQQGNDWRPIVGTIILAIGIVVAIDAVSYIVLGT
jgi:hypothetical protein